MKEKILYIHIGKSTFVKKDIEILNKKFELKEFHFNVSNKLLLFFEFFKQFFFLALNFKTKKIVSQFGGFHTVLPSLFSKIFKRKHLIILSGTDCVSFPSINYGNFNRLFLAFATKISIKNASKLLPVSQELVKSNYSYQTNDFPFQGYSYHIPNVKTEYSVVHYGYNQKLWQAYHPKEKNSFVTVAANLNSRFGLKLKGIDLIIESASKLTDCTFYIVGGKKINKDLKIPKNIKLIDNIPNDKLKEFIGSKQYYLQLSLSEGFPNALCEAMLCECIPIVSNVSSMPFIIGESGEVLLKNDTDLLVKLIHKLVSKENKIELGLKARNRIINEFPIQKREDKLIHELTIL